MTSPAGRLNALMQSDQIIPLPGIYDAMSARLLQQAGLPVAYLSGYCVSAAHLGLPDVGYLTMTEMLGVARNVTSAVDIPVIVDGDDGYGNHLNVNRLVRELEKIGVAGVQIEDQVAPKRCGHMNGKRVVTKQLMLDKIAAFLDARQDSNFTLIARTDALAVNGYEDALDRALSYQEAGATVVFVEAPVSEEQVRDIAEKVTAPKVFNWAFGGKSPTFSARFLQELGYKFVQCPDIIFPVARILRNFYAEIAASGTYEKLTDQMVSFDEFNAMVGLDRVAEMDRKYGR